MESEHLHCSLWADVTPTKRALYVSEPKHCLSMHLFAYLFVTVIKYDLLKLHLIAANAKANGKTALGKWEEKSPSEAPSRPDSSLLQNTTLKFGLEGNVSHSDVCFHCGCRFLCHRPDSFYMATDFSVTAGL